VSAETSVAIREGI